MPYPVYKDSGVEWLGEIPAGWEVKKLAWITKCLDGRRVPLNAEERGRMQGEYPYWGANTIIDYVDRWLFDEDLVLLGEDGAPFFDRARSVAFHVNGKIWVNNHAHVLRPAPGVDPGFLAQVLNCVDYRAFIDGSTRDKLTQGDMNAIPIQYPQVSEQRAIAIFLDRETARIDALVAKKERLLELLHERRTALITRAVTKGLDPNVPMKDSGVEWLGEIPGHWEVEENRWLFRESDVRSQLGEEELLTVSHITGVTRRSEKPDVTMIEAESHEGYKVCGSGELAINTMWAWMGALGIAQEPGMVSPSYNVYRITSDRLVPHYYDYVCRIPLHVAEIIRHSKGIWQSRLRLYPDAFRELLTPLPPIGEQRAIAAFLDRETASIDALVAKIRTAIDRLKELRTALISAAVTGKIDVRQEVA
jgi:type I restriction enzyme S subunit